MDLPNLVSTPASDVSMLQNYFINYSYIRTHVSFICSCKFKILHVVSITDGTIDTARVQECRCITPKVSQYHDTSLHLSIHPNAIIIIISQAYIRRTKIFSPCAFFHHLAKYVNLKLFTYIGFHWSMHCNSSIYQCFNT